MFLHFIPKIPAFFSSKAGDLSNQRFFRGYQNVENQLCTLGQAAKSGVGGRQNSRENARSVTEMLK